MNFDVKFPLSFFDEEIRDEYTVTSQMKKLWAVEIDLLFQLDKICKKYGLKYVADGGTLLGAIRHQGYIPWDDDIDICMLRSDYEKLCKVAPLELQYPYFFQNEETDPGCVFGFSKICNSETTMILECNKKRDFQYNQGINIDIFPQDNVPDDEEERAAFFSMLQKLRKRAKKFRGLMHLNVGEKNILKKILSFVAKILKIRNIPYYQFEKFCQKYNGTKCKCCASISFNPVENVGFKHADSFDKIKLVPFEFFTIPITEDSEWYLNNFYGDWRTPVKNKSFHGSLIIDTEKSYKDYVKRFKSE